MTDNTICPFTEKPLRIANIATEPHNWVHWTKLRIAFIMQFLQM